MQKIYDWDRIFAGGRAVLHRGRDYDCSQLTIVQQIRNAASLRGLAVRIVDGGDRVTVEVIRSRKGEQKCLL